MTANARDALRLLVAALEEHLEAVASRRSSDDAAVDDAFEGVAVAFERYEEALDLEFAEALPLVIDDVSEFEEIDDDALDDDLDDDDIDDDDIDDEDAVSPVDRGELDDHAAEDEDDLDDDLDEFDLR